MYVVGQMSFNYNILRSTAYWRQCQRLIVFTSVYLSRWNLVTHISQGKTFCFVSKNRKGTAGWTSKMTPWTKNVSKAGSFIIKCLMNEMVWKEEKGCLRHAMNSPKHFKLSCDDPDDFSYIVNVIVSSHLVLVSVLSLNSLSNPIIHCYSSFL